MKSGGKVEAGMNNDVTKAAAAMFRGISSVRDLAGVDAVVKSAAAAVSGFSTDAQAAYRGITRTSSGISGASRFADRSEVTSDIKGNTPRVLAMAAVLSKPGPMSFDLLARVIKDIA